MTSKWPAIALSIIYSVYVYFFLCCIYNYYIQPNDEASLPFIELSLLFASFVLFCAYSMDGDNRQKLILYITLQRLCCFITTNDLFINILYFMIIAIFGPFLSIYLLFKNNSSPSIYQFIHFYQLFIIIPYSVLQCIYMNNIYSLLMVLLCIIYISISHRYYYYIDDCTVNRRSITYFLFTEMLMIFISFSVEIHITNTFIIYFSLILFVICIYSHYLLFDIFYSNIYKYSTKRVYQYIVSKPNDKNMMIACFAAFETIQQNKYETVHQKLIKYYNYIKSSINDKKQFIDAQFKGDNVSIFYIAIKCSPHCALILYLSPIVLSILEMNNIECIFIECLIIIWFISFALFLYYLLIVDKIHLSETSYFVVSRIYSAVSSKRNEFYVLKLHEIKEYHNILKNIEFMVYKFSLYIGLIILEYIYDQQTVKKRSKNSKTTKKRRRSAQKKKKSNK